MKKLLLSLSLIAFSSTINAQWTSQATNFDAESRGLEEIRIVDANIVWAKAYDGSGLGATVQEFTRTSNGGASWQSGFIDVGDPTLNITNICAVSELVAWAGAVQEVDGFGGVYKTTDGGASWNQQNTAAYTTAGQSYFNVVHFFDENVGLTMGDPKSGEYEMYRTTDGGDTWTAIPAAALPNPTSGEYGYTGNYFALGNNFWFTTNKGRIYKTTDQGITWTVAQAPITDFGSAASSGSIGFSNANTGFLLKTVGTTYTFYTTSNGADTWTAGTPFSGTRRILSYIPGTTTIVATSLAAPVGTSVSTDNGTSWTDVESGAQRGFSAFLNATTGWCAGFSGALVDGIFKLTSPLATNDVIATAKFKVYPNPATATVTISATDVDSYKLSVTDLTGKTVMTKSLNGMENNVDVSALSSGAYFFEMSSDNKREVVKILKN